MPHFVIEYSSNLDREVDWPALLTGLRDAAVASGIFPFGGIRLRAERRDLYLIADGHPDNAFVHVTAHIAQGRTDEVKARFAADFMAALEGFFESRFEQRPLALSLQVYEAPPEALNLKKNNTYQWIERRGTQP